jgi:hypothetical protein
MNSRNILLTIFCSQADPFKVTKVRLVEYQ